MATLWEYLCLYLLRPALALVFVLALISLGWFFAWKLVLVHVPLVQEICGLRKKPKQPKPLTRRLSRIYSSAVSAKAASDGIKLEAETKMEERAARRSEKI